MNIPIDRHLKELEKNMKVWQNKPLLRFVYNKFYEQIIAWLKKDDKPVVEIGSGIGNFKKACPQCIATDIFNNEWIDQVESAYHLSFKDNSLSNIILFDVLHHLHYPGSALKEFERVLEVKGRLIIYDPYISLFGAFVYGLFHHEPLRYYKDITWETPQGVDPDKEYYAAQGNSRKIFKQGSEYLKMIESKWNIVYMKKTVALTYILCGGFSKPALYPLSFYPLIKFFERIVDIFPFIFATRVFIVLEKR